MPSRFFLTQAHIRLWHGGGDPRGAHGEGHEVAQLVLEGGLLVASDLQVNGHLIVPVHVAVRDR